MKKNAFPSKQSYKKGDMFVIEVDDDKYVYGRVLLPNLFDYGGLAAWKAVLCLYDVVDSVVDMHKILPPEKVYGEPFITDGEGFFKAIGRVVRHGYLDETEKFPMVFIRYYDDYWDESFNKINFIPERSVDGNITKFIEGVYDLARRVAGLPIRDIPEKMARRLKVSDPQFYVHFPNDKLEGFLAANDMDLFGMEGDLCEVFEDNGFGQYGMQPPPSDDKYTDFLFFLESPETFAGGVQVVAKWLRERKAPKEVMIEGYSPKKKVMALYSKTIDNLK